MKIALINPPRTRLVTDSVRTGTPLGLLSLAGMVRKHLPEIEVHFIDAVAEGTEEIEIKPRVFRFGLTSKELRERLGKIGPDVVGITNIFTSEWKSAAFCAAVAKEVSPEIKVLLGGHHPTYTNQFMMSKTHTDFIIQGEGEFEFLKFLGGSTPCSTSNLDELEDPAFDLLNPRLYGPKLSHSGKVPGGCKSLADFSISRGCPIGCTFCTSTQMWGKKVRVFSPGRIRGQIRKLRQVGFDHVSIEDDQVLMIPEPSLRTMFDELGKQGFAWNIDAGLYYPLIPRNEEILRFAAASGCYRIFLPIEHPAIDIIHGEHKYRNLKTQDDIKREITQACESLRVLGIEFYVAMVVGFKQETEETLRAVEEYARFVIEQGAEWVNFFYPKPLPGTPDYTSYDLVPEERRWENAPEYWSFSTPVLKPDAMSLEDLVTAVDSISLEVNGFRNALLNPERGGKLNG